MRNSHSKSHLYIINKHNPNQKIKFWWLRLFTPNYYLRSFDDLSTNTLKQNRIKILVCDIDNTLVPYYKPYPSKEAIQFVQRIEQANIKVILMSNNSVRRVRKIAKMLGVEDYYGLAFKPWPHYLNDIVRNHKIQRNEIMVFGDQLLTDILMSNFFRCPSILTLPLLSVTKKKRNRLFLLIERFIYLKLTDYHILPRNIDEQQKDIKRGNFKFDWF